MQADASENRQNGWKTQRTIADKALWPNDGDERAVRPEDAPPRRLDVTTADEIQHPVDACSPNTPQCGIPWLTAVVEHQ